MEAPEGPVLHLTCADGVLVGSLGRHGLFVLDPSIGVGVRHLDVDLGGELDFLVVTSSIAWAVPAGRPRHGSRSSGRPAELREH